MNDGMARFGKWQAAGSILVLGVYLLTWTGAAWDWAFTWYMIGQTFYGLWMSRLHQCYRYIGVVMYGLTPPPWYFSLVVLMLMYFCWPLLMYGGFHSKRAASYYEATATKLLQQQLEIQMCQSYLEEDENND